MRQMGSLIEELSGKVEHLYVCHVQGMEVIAQQQALIATLHKDLRIVKSAVTYMSAKINYAPNDAGAVGEEGAGAEQQGPASASATTRTVAQLAEQLESSCADLVEARGALVAAMQWADAAQQAKADGDFLKFKQQIEACGLLSSPNTDLRLRSSGSARSKRTHLGPAHEHAAQAADAGQADEISGGASGGGGGGGGGGQADGVEGGREGRWGFQVDSPSPARRKSSGYVGEASDASPEQMQTQRRTVGQGEVHQVQEGGGLGTEVLRFEFARPPSRESSLRQSPAETPLKQAPSPGARSSPASGSSSGTAAAHTPVRERTPVREVREGVRTPVRDRAGKEGVGASPGVSVSTGRGGAAAGTPRRLTADEAQVLEECKDEAADELVTTRLALRNVGPNPPPLSPNKNP
jgi:hypothetical protein